MFDQTKVVTTATPMTPMETNPMGNIFGGEILSHIDHVGFMAAGSVCADHVGRVATVAMDKVLFKKPVHVDDILLCHARVTRIGRSSISVHVEVEALRNGEKIPVTAADAVYVAVNKRGRPVPVRCSRAKSSASGSSRKQEQAGTAHLPDTSKCPVPCVPMMPRDRNSMGSILAGVILSNIDLSGAIAARAVCSRGNRRVVTVAMDKIVFKRPVHVGDILQCYAEVTNIGNTSISTHIEVVAKRGSKLIPVTAADAVYVAIDKNGRPTAVRGKAGRSSADASGKPSTGITGKRQGASPKGDSSKSAGQVRRRRSCACKRKSN